MTDWEFTRIITTYMHKTQARPSDSYRALITSDTCSYKTAYTLDYSEWNAHITNATYPFSESEGMVSSSLNGKAAGADPLCA